MSTPQTENREGFRPPPRSTARTVLLVGTVLVSLGVVIFAFRQATPIPDVEVPTPPPVAPMPADKVAIRLQPSLVVPGPAQIARPWKRTEEARPDDVMLFRVNLNQPGYVLVGGEDEAGKFYRFYGGLPDQKPTSGSELLTDGLYPLGHPLAPYKGHSIRFVAVVSDKPWKEIPERLPQEPASYPTVGGPELSLPPGILAWDRIEVKVAGSLPGEAESTPASLPSEKSTPSDPALDSPQPGAALPSAPNPAQPASPSPTP